MKEEEEKKKGRKIEKRSNPGTKERRGRSPTFPHKV